MSYLDDVWDHWESQLKKHQEAFRIGGVYLIGGSGAVTAYSKVVEQNQIARAREANEAALKEIAQGAPSTTLGATGTFQITEGIKQWIPFVLIAILVAYFLFKD